MHGVGRSGKPQEGEAGELEGSDCAGADQAQDQRTYQSDEAARGRLTDFEVKSTKNI